IANFWGTMGEGIYGQTGMYMTGFFPVMMFGLPAGALATYHTAKDNKKKVVYGLLLAAALSSFFTGVTEPLEFAFMFLAPGLYVVHALLTGISAAVCTLLPVRAGFNFSAGFVDWFLSYKAPMAENPWLIIPIGIVFAIIYYVVFRIVITKFNLKTPGREEDNEDELTDNIVVSGDMNELAKSYIQALGGKENIVSVDNCVTRLRLGVKDNTIIKDKSLTALGARGVIRPGKGNIQVIVGTNVQFVADAVKAELKK
ncbi:MAG: glucose PTS transporter subunit EIIB, partial [Staphylococcus epidermidis]|nr:glucose PTS transporter subunit EIIB [Staphylococcus epidermidis]